SRELRDSAARELERDRDRDEKARTSADRGAVKPTRRHANDRQRDIVDGQRLPENLGIAAELALPVRVAQHDSFGLTVDPIVRRAEESPERGQETEGREVAPRDQSTRREPGTVVGR